MVRLKKQWRDGAWGCSPAPLVYEPHHGLRVPIEDTPLRMCQGHPPMHGAMSLAVPFPSPHQEFGAGTLLTPKDLSQGIPCIPNPRTGDKQRGLGCCHLPPLPTTSCHPGAQGLLPGDPMARSHPGHGFLVMGKGMERPGRLRRLSCCGHRCCSGPLPRRGPAKNLFPLGTG